MRGREGVVDEDVAELGERRDEGRIVLFLARWKRVFSRQRMSPGFIAATAASAASPMQSSANATGRLMTCATSAATGFSESFGSRPFGRPKCDSRITLPPLSAISVMVGATRSMRVASVTLPFSIGTLRSTRTSTRLPFTSAWSRVRNARHGQARPRAASDQLAHRHGGVGHAVGEAPLVVVPGHHAHEACRPSPWSGPCGRSRSADRG